MSTLVLIADLFSGIIIGIVIGAIIFVGRGPKS